MSHSSDRKPLKKKTHVVTEIILSVEPPVQHQSWAGTSLVLKPILRYPRNGIFSASSEIDRAPSWNLVLKPNPNPQHFLGCSFRTLLIYQSAFIHSQLMPTSSCADHIHEFSTYPCNLKTALLGSLGWTEQKQGAIFLVWSFPVPPIIPVFSYWSIPVWITDSVMIPFHMV